jgi:hypothetical protein
MRIRYKVALLLMVYLLLAWRKNPNMNPIDRFNDSQLVYKIKKVAGRKGLKPNQVEHLVGTPAVLNTTDPSHRFIFLRASIDFDESEHSEISSFQLTTDVVYWARPIEAPNPRMVGICWTQSGEQKVFFAIVYPCN